VKVTLVVGILGILALASLGPIGFSAAHLTLLTSVVIYALIAVSLVVLTGWAGQISLGQFAFVGIGAGCAGAMLVHAHADLFLVLGGAALAGGVAAFLLGLPSLRIPGLYLAVVTMAFAVPVSTWLLDGTYFPALTPQVVRRPVLFDRVRLSSPLALYEFCLVVLVVAFLLARNFRRSRAGRVVLAVRENERAASSYGIAPWRAKLVAFTFSGMLAGLAGALYTLNLRGVSFAGFDPEKSIVVFTMVVVGGMGSLGGAILGALYVQGAQYFLTGAAQLLATGAGLLVLLLIIPGGIGEIIGRIRDRLLVAVARERAIAVPALDRKASRPTEGQKNEVVTSARRAPVGAEAWAPPSPEEAAFLAAEGVGTCYGSVQVLFGANLAVQRGQVMALLGTNGAGKTTLMDACSGFVPLKSGRILLEGLDLTSLPAYERSLLGVGRLFQDAMLFPSMTVTEALATSLDRHVAVQEPIACTLGLGAARDSEEEVEAFVEQLLSDFGLEGYRDAFIGELSTGTRRIVELAGVMAHRPAVLLADEPSSGIAQRETEALARALVGIVHATGAGLVVIEHDVPMISSIADRLICLNLGCVIAEGPPDEVLNDPLVIAAYLGEDDAAIARSEPWHRIDPLPENPNGQTNPRITNEVFSQS
jgi:ABC-type branched-subunit amino acid transport system ATPase component/ABC-type branched-subunit amino acid transport system permease subunit